MKKLLFPFCFIIGCLVVGCGEKENPINGDNGEETEVPRVVADTLMPAPSTIAANDGIWANVDSTIVEIGFSSEYGQNSQMIKDTVLMKVILKSDMLYIWVRWKDPTPDIWGNYSLKSTGTGLWQHIVSADGNGGEDAFMIIFDAGDNGTEGADCSSMCHVEDNKMATTGGGHADAWCWKAARLAPANLAEDNWWTGVGNYLDPRAQLNPQLPYQENWITQLAWPRWMHPDDTAFAGPYLYVEDAVAYDPSPFIGWDSAAGYKMPGHLIDSTIHSMATRDDRWDVLAASVYDSLISPHYWIVVFSRTLAPPTSNDVDFRELDSIQVTIAASNEHTFAEDPGWREHSGSVPFYIIFNPPAE